ncbi:MAG: MtrB/PioB family decaheme-associated outer membrane protein [Desulfuromonadales bacterium]|nr:MtrB/PioB family decaheme-associated outer membrane protein [Desulfuromonadales bacterium]
MKRYLFTAALALLMPAAALAQDNVNGLITAGVQQVDVDPNSSKFNEYRDIGNGAYLYNIGLDALLGDKGNYLEVEGKNVGRDDQKLQLGLGRYGLWNLNFSWDEITHRLSNKAQTPYTRGGSGLYVVPQTVPEFIAPGPFFKDLVPTPTEFTTANDPATEAYLAANLHKTSLKNDREKATASFSYSLLENLKLRLTASNEDREGNKITYGPIGDRPPRSLNIQFTEPIDYRTQEVKFETDYLGKKVQANFTYLLSKFENKVDTLTWQNIFTGSAGTDAAGTYELWVDAAATSPATRHVATFGRRALAPDNQYQNVSLTFGVNLPLDSRLAATAALGRMEQDEDLIPYSTNGTLHAADNNIAWNDPAKLPRSSADAEIDTKLFNLDYTVNPIKGLNLRAFYRFYDLENKTDEANWWYATSDTVGTAGQASYKNKRVNLAYAYDKQNYGLDSRYSLGFWRSTVGLGYEREEIDRDYREADTDENIYKLSFRSRPANWLSMRAKYQYGDREAKSYNNNVTSESYWYAPADVGADNDNPQFTFSNHPDTRKYDVSDRERNLFEISATVSPVDVLDFSAYYRYKKDDFDSDVKPAQPLFGTTLADAAAITPGIQIGLLEDERQQYGLDVSYAPTQRLTLNAFASREDSETRQRGFEFNENNKQNPSAVAGSELGPWTRASSQWTADIKDRTNTFGAGAGFVIIPEKLNFVTDYTVSFGKIDIDYDGFGEVSAITAGQTLADDYQFAFRDPSTIRNNRYTLNVNLEYQVVENLIIGLGYMFERYKTKDWQQEANTPWFGAVNGNEHLLRDSSFATSNQWGNRLPNMGSYLAPTYEAHVGTLALTYKF